MPISYDIINDSTNKDIDIRNEELAITPIANRTSRNNPAIASSSPSRILDENTSPTSTSSIPPTPLIGQSGNESISAVSPVFSIASISTSTPIGFLEAHGLVHNRLASLSFGNSPSTTPNRSGSDSYRKRMREHSPILGQNHEDIGNHRNAKQRIRDLGSELKDDSFDSEVDYEMMERHGYHFGPTLSDSDLPPLHVARDSPLSLRASPPAARRLSGGNSSDFQNDVDALPPFPYSDTESVCVPPSPVDRDEADEVPGTPEAVDRSDFDLNLSLSSDHEHITQAQIEAGYVPKTPPPTPTDPFENRFHLAQCVFEVQHRLRGDLPSACRYGLKEQHEALENIVHSLCTAGQSGSVLLVGDKGSGKSFVVNNVLTPLQKSHKILLVRLSGLLQTDDTMALKEVTRQVCLNQNTDEYKRQTRGTFMQHLEFLFSVLREGNAQSVPVVFVLERFEVFVHKQKQTLLYNLLDLTQTQNSILVIGCTERLDVVEHMEKRIKSRFSNNLLYMPKPSLSTVQDILLERLQLEEPAIPSWNACTAQLIREDSECIRILDNLVAQGYSVAWFLKCFSVAVARLLRKSHARNTLSVEDIVAARDSFVFDFKTEAVMALSSIELTMLIAMVQLEKIHKHPMFNFEMVYAHIKDKYFKQFGSLDQQFSKNVAHKAFEHLLHVKLIAFSTTMTSSEIAEDERHEALVTAGQGRSSNIQPHYRHVRLVIDPESILSLVRECDSNGLPCSTSLEKWAQTSNFV